MSDLLKDLLEKRDAAFAAFEGLAGALLEQDEEITDEQQEQRSKLRSKVDRLDVRLTEVKADEERASNLAEMRAGIGVADAETETGTETRASVTSEPRTYGAESPHSYYMDLARLAVPSCSTHGMAQQRMSKHTHEMGREAHLDTPIGRSAIAQMREVTRSENEVEHRSAMQEFRDMGASEHRTALSTGGGATASASGGSAAAMVAPFVIGDYVPFREAGRAIADSLNRRPLPPYGVNLYIPNVTGPAGVAAQTEGNTVTETDPSFGYLSNSIVTEAGQVTVSQQSLDRAGPGFSMDEVISDALRRDLAPKVDVYAITQILSGAGSITNNSASWSVSKKDGTGGLYGLVSNAKQAIRTATGVFLNPNVMAMTPGRWELVAGAADSTGRPLVIPEAMGKFQAVASASGTGDAGLEASGRTNYLFNTLPVLQDFNLPTPTTGADQVVVMDSSVILFYEGTPVSRAVPQTLANKLQVLIQLYEYLTVLVLYPTAVQTISGTFFATPAYS